MTCSRQSSCCFCVAALTCTSMSSMWHNTPGRSTKSSDIRFWKNSLAKQIPNGNLLNRYLSKGVINVVKWRDSSARFICQNPEFASSLVKTLLPDNFANDSSTDGRGWFSLLNDSFNCVRSTQILTWPFGFGTTTMPEHHSVGSSTFEITLILAFFLAHLWPLSLKVWGLFAEWTERMALHRGLEKSSIPILFDLDLWKPTSTYCDSTIQTSRPRHLHYSDSSRFSRWLIRY